MPVEVPSKLLRADTVKNAYRGVAQSQFRILERDMQLGGLPVSSRTVIYDNGVVIKCSCCFNQKVIDIFVPDKVTEISFNEARLSGFGTKPRFGGVKRFYGYNNNDEEVEYVGINASGVMNVAGKWYTISGIYAYPMVDGNRGTVVITEKGKFVYSSGINFGNNYWFNDKVTISWKGPPSVQFPLYYSVDGLTMMWGVSLTPFNFYAYSKGVMIQAPSNEIVLGACYTVDKDGKIWLILITNFRPEGGGYLLRIWKKALGTKYILIGEFTETRGLVSATITTDGKKFHVLDGIFTIDDTVSVVSKVSETLVSASGTQTITGTGGYKSSYLYEGRGECWPAISKNGDRLLTHYSVTGDFSSDENNHAEPNRVQVPVYTGDPATSISVNMTDSANYPCSNGGKGEGYDYAFAATVNGSYCSIVWSGVDCFKGGLAGKRLKDKCEQSFTITATLMPQGISDTLTFDSEVDEMQITGPQNSGNVNSPGITTGQYGVINALGEVTWSVSCGTISEGGLAVFDGCGCPTATATVTAVDKCGRTASIDVITAQSGTWITTSRCCLTQAQRTAAGLDWMICHSADEGSGCDSYNIFSGSNYIEYQANSGIAINASGGLQNFCGSSCGGDWNTTTSITKTVKTFVCL